MPALLASLLFLSADTTVWTDPAAAATEEPAFSVQGEYRSDDWGLQVIARGGDKLEAYLLEGGLPGDGFAKDNARTKLTGVLRKADARLTGDAENLVAEIADGVAHVVRDGRKIAELKRVERKSPTLGAEPPEDAVVLFDGTNADAWKRGKVEDGLLLNHDVTTKQTFGGYRLHLEFRTPYMPFATGQARGNSGVYHQGRYETQVLDSFGLEGKNNEAGGIYEIADPIVNAALPPLTWQTYDVDLTAARFDEDGNLTAPARMTVRLNGVLVQDDVAVPRTTRAAPVREVTPDPGPIYLQHHGNEVRYRNIWLVPKD